MLQIDFKKYWKIVKPYGPVSILPIFAITCIYADWSRTQKYKALKEIEQRGTSPDFSRAFTIK